MTTPITRPNKRAIIDATDIFRDAMRPFIVRNLQSVRGASVQQAIESCLSGNSLFNFQKRLRTERQIQGAIDLNDMPHIIGRYWKDAFGGALNYDQTSRNLMWLIVESRNAASHPGSEDIDINDAATSLTLIARMLGRINEPANQRRVEEIRDQLQSEVPPPPAEPATQDKPNARPAAVRARGVNITLKPWREVIRPNRDIVNGDFAHAEFAANLQKVHDNDAPSGYANPVIFFGQTHITAGIRSLLVNTLKRISGNGGDPVIQTRTGFGGGKTHSLIAIHHVIKHNGALTNPSDGAASDIVAKEIRAIMNDAGANPDDGVQAQVAVLDGTHLSPTDEQTTDDGSPLNTLWGVMAYQLGGQLAYDIIGAAARSGSAPGGAQLDALLAHVGPCVIMIDEIIAYARNKGADLDSIYTFMQNLTQTVGASKNAALVVTLPETNTEAGDERGRQALNTIGHLFARLDALWTPLEVHEAYEVVRRRIFGADIDEDQRDKTCETFHRLYIRQKREYPDGVADPRYLATMKTCYPIHPEVFTRLYNDWSSYPQFQRTRGVLRIMSNWVSRLYRDGDPSPLIMPASLPLSDPSVSQEFTRMLGDGQWQPVISEADSDGSRTDVIDGSVAAFGEMGGAARRLARAIFYGSARSGVAPGVDTRAIMLGVVQPGHQPSPYKEALQRMSQSLYYLYSEDGRYYFYAEENLTKVAGDRIGNLDPARAPAYIVQALQAAARMSSNILICPAGSEDVPDTDELRLVVIHPNRNIRTRATEADAARDFALDVLDSRGNSPRIRKNGLLFLAAKTDDCRALIAAAAKVMAWDSIINGDNRVPNLRGQRASQARAQLQDARAEFDNALVRAYSRVLAPAQPSPNEAAYDFTETGTAAHITGEIFSAAFEACRQNETLAPVIAPSALLNMLDRYIWSGAAQPRDHIGVGELWEMTRAYVYMHRLSDKSALRECVANGVQSGEFGYADSYDGADYGGMRLGDGSFTAADVADGGLIVARDMAQLVIEETPAAPPAYAAASAAQGGAVLDAPAAYPEQAQPIDAPLRHIARTILARKRLTGDISTDDFADIRAEIVQVLARDGAEVEVEITVRATKPDGFSDHALRAARENAVQLGLDIEND